MYIYMYVPHVFCKVTDCYQPARRYVCMIYNTGTKYNMNNICQAYVRHHIIFNLVHVGTCIMYANEDVAFSHRNFLPSSHRPLCSRQGMTEGTRSGTRTTAEKNHGGVKTNKRNHTADGVGIEPRRAA